MRDPRIFHNLPSSQNGTGPRPQFAKPERLNDIVIGATVQPRNAINFLNVMPGYHNDRNVRARSDCPEELIAIGVAELKVEKNQTRFLIRKKARSVRSSDAVRVDRLRSSK